jgi:FMN-dependent NADH-azoreductase
MNLFINACVRDNSRTRILAEHLLKKLEGEITEEKLEGMDFPKVDAAFLKKRDELIETGKFNDTIFIAAQRFASADNIIIAAPYWDLSFPSILKQYFEQINVVGITFAYSKEGIPVSLCKAKRLYYVTTAGGYIASNAYGFGYIEALAKSFYGIPETHFIKAEGLAIAGADTAGIIMNAAEEIDRLFC